MNLNIHRGSIFWITIKTDDNTRHISQLLGQDIIKSSFNSHIFLDINIGDFIVYDDVIYHINSLPNIKKNSINSYDYNITFESESYELLKTQFLDTDGNSDFYLMGNLETFIDLIITNMVREHTGWAKGTCDQTNSDYKLLSFSKNNCMQVLQKLYEEFEGEFYFTFALDYEEGAELPYLPAADAVIGYKPAAEAEHGYHPTEFSIYSYTKDICFTDKAGSDSGLTFKYKQGLRNITRNTLSEKNIITRLYAFGSTKNLAIDYRDHCRRLKFVTIDEKSYLEKNIDKYGTIEHTELFEDIYPHREGTISWVDEGDITKFKDTNEPLMFDLNEYLLPGVTAKLHFNSGNLGGYEFEVSNYNNATKEFTIIAYQDEVGYEMPNATLKPAVGDKYVLLEIELPQSYIDTAETALQAKAQTYINDNCEPRVTYILEPDWRYFQTHLISLKVGDFITIQDTDLGINVMTRIVELTKSVANEYKYTLKLTDHLEVQLIQRLYDEQEDLKEKIEIGEGGNIIRSRRNWRTSEELRTMIFDTDGYFDMGKIRPESVETGMLSVGSKSTQFILSGVEIEGNYTSDVSKFHASAGSLIHLSIADEITTWTLSENSQDSLVDETAYYIYAKCTKEPGYTGQIVVDGTQRKFDDDETYYYFLIGVLHSVVDSVRGVSLTYGQTIINGRFIRTGKIESTDSLTYFDLDNGIIQGKIQFIANTSGYANISDKPDLSIYDAKAKVFRQATAPTSGMQAGDIWIDTDDGDKPRTYNGADWILTYTIINGGNIETGSIIADRLDIDYLSAISANLGAITAGTIQISNTGYIRTVDKTSYADTTAGFWLGYEGGAYKLNIGSAANWLKWDGSALQIKGRLSVGSGTDEDIYFEDSGIRLYDATGAQVTFAKAGLASFSIYMNPAYSEIITTTLKIYASEKISAFYSSGQLQLPTLADAPVSNNYNGEIAVPTIGLLHNYHHSAWYLVNTTEGW